MNITFEESKPFSKDSPIYLVEGVTETFTCIYWGATSTASAVAYKRKKDVSSTVFPSGSVSTSGSTVILKPMTALTYGTYIVAVTATVGGSVKVKKFKVEVQKDETE